MQRICKFVQNYPELLYTKVIEKLDAFYKVRTNVIYERARFNRRNQQQGESIDQYITVLHRLVDTCGYPDNLKSETVSSLASSTQLSCRRNYNSIAHWTSKRP